MVNRTEQTAVTDCELLPDASCLPLVRQGCQETSSIPEEGWDLDSGGRQTQAAVVTQTSLEAHLTHTEGIIQASDGRGGTMCVRPVFKALGTVPTVITHRKKAIEREKALARGPKAGFAADPLCWEDRETQSWLGHLTGRGCARQRSRKQEARTLSQDLNVFRKWPRREEGECLSESSKQKPGHWPGSRRRHGLDNSEPILESLRASMWPPPWVWRSSDREPAPVCETPASPALCPGLAGRAGQGTESQ